MVWYTVCCVKKGSRFLFQLRALRDNKVYIPWASSFQRYLSLCKERRQVAFFLVLATPGLSCGMPAFSWGVLLFTRPVMSDSLRRYGLQHTRSPSPSPSPGVCPSSCLLKLMSFASVMPSSHLIVCLPLLLLPSILPSIRVFSNELAVGTGDQSWGMQDLVLWPGIELWPPALGVQNLNHWTTKRVPQLAFILKRQKIAITNNQWWTQCQRIYWVKDFCRSQWIKPPYAVSILITHVEAIW